MKISRLFALLILAVCGHSLNAATATATLQVVWPDEALGINQSEAFAKAVQYLKSSEFVDQVARMPQDRRAQYAMFARINNARNTNAIAQSIADNLTVTGHEEQGSIAITFSNNSPDLAVYVAQFAAEQAVTKSRYYIAEKADPAVQSISRQMEEVQDNIQMIQAQIRTTNQIKNNPNIRGASIGAPIDMGRVVHPEKTQARAQISGFEGQLKELRQQYNQLNQQLRQQVNQAWKGKPKAGLILIDHADLDGGSL
ncbi:hypothetical protein [Cerasicoccus frondis]|uniref:hypothetical protein n=1 Tax=Cerasicoccus frondis TaxID=490090 RepID=UPI002852A1D7|nr:hypothetical protein [Cerasicoccus frondis]